MHRITIGWIGCEVDDIVFKLIRLDLAYAKVLALGMTEIPATD